MNIYFTKSATLLLIELKLSIDWDKLVLVLIVVKKVIIGLIN